jgi:pectin methylesterase-like acyl-CoA thioesterase
LNIFFTFTTTLTKNLSMSVLSAELQSFITQSASLVAKTKAIAVTLAPNTAQVWPGGATFNTIQAAIDSITGASQQEIYQVAVGSGTFNENVVMADYIYVIGAGQEVTIITASAQQNFAAGVVNSASGGGISELTINAPGSSWGGCPMGIKICGSGNFHVSGITINSGTGSNGDNVRGISNNTGSYTGNIIIGQSIFTLTGDDQSTCVGIDLFGNAFGSNALTVFINLTSVEATGGQQNFGVSTSVGATVTLDDSKIIANTWALYNSDGGSPITANQCIISGPVSSGVVVNK